MENKQTDSLETLQTRLNDLQDRDTTDLTDDEVWQYNEDIDKLNGAIFKMTTDLHATHLETLSSHGEAVDYLTPLKRSTLDAIAKVLDISKTGTRDKLLQAIVATTVDYRLRSQAIRSL